jgi:hypothetical protein
MVDIQQTAEAHMEACSKRTGPKHNQTAAEHHLPTCWCLGCLSFTPAHACVPSLAASVPVPAMCPAAGLWCVLCGLCAVPSALKPHPIPSGCPHLAAAHHCCMGPSGNLLHLHQRSGKQAGITHADSSAMSWVFEDVASCCTLPCLHS